MQIDYCTSRLQHLTSLKQLPVLLSKSVSFEHTGRLSNEKEINSVVYKHDDFQTAALNKSSQVNAYSFYPLHFS
jgi:hypothetical protein